MSKFQRKREQIALKNPRDGGAPLKRISEVRRHLPALLGLAAGLTLKIVIGAQLSDHLLLQANGSPDSAAYVELAYRAASGNWTLGPGLYFVSPLYIYFLAGVLTVFDSLAVAKVIQVALGICAVAFIWVATRECFDAPAAWYAAALASLTGLFTFYEITFLHASLDVFLTSAFLAALALGLFRHKWYWLSAAGFVSGFQTLNRPNVLIAIVGILVLITLMRRWRLAIALAGGLAIGLAPGLIRNVVVVGEWSLATSHGGLNFLIGNGPGANGLYRAIPDIRPNINGQAVDTRRLAEASAGQSLSDSEVSWFFTRSALSWVWHEPTAWLKLMVKKIYYTFHGQHVALPLSYPFFAYDTGSWLQFLPVGPWLLLPLGSFGLLSCVPRIRASAYYVWASFVPGYAIAVALFFVSERYRLPLLVPMVIGAGAALGFLESKVRAGQWSAVVRTIGSIVLLAVLMNWPLGWTDGDGRLEERLRMAESLAATGDRDGARTWASRALPGYPYEREARLRLGRAFAGQKDLPLALENFQAAYEIDPTDPGAVLELSRVAIEAGQVETARMVLTRLAVVPSASPELWLALGRVGMTLEMGGTAQRFFLQAVQIAPESSEAREQLGLSYLVSKQFESARRELAEVVRLTPGNSEGWAYLAVALLQLGERAEAVRSADRALSLAPDNPVAGQVKKAAGVLR